MRATIVVCLLLGSILSAGINGSFRDNNSYIADIAVAGNRKNAIDDEKLVLAFYYAWYRNDGWWRYWPLRAAHHPVLGAYNSSDPKVIAQHIKWAKEAGIDGFIVSWWGINSIANNNTRKIIEIANREDFTITIYYETTKTMGKTDEDAKNEIIDEITYIIDTYSDESCFLRFENRPVIFVYALWTHTRYFWENVTKALREKMNIFLIGDGKPNEYPYFDGYHLYNPKDIPPESLLNSYKKFKEFLQGAVVTVQSGGALKPYFMGKADQYTRENRIEQRQMIESLGIMAEAYVSAAVAGILMILVVIPVMMIISNQFDPVLLYLISVILIPLVHIGFAVILTSMITNV